MKTALSSRIISYADGFHQRFFGHGMSSEMREFVGNLSWSFFGGLLASAVMFAVTILAGRWLGPAEYGKYNSLLSLATALAAFFLFGMNTTSVRFLSDPKYAAQQRTILSTALITVCIVTAVITLLLVGLQDWILPTVKQSLPFLVAAILLGFALSLKNMNDGFLRAVNRIKLQSSLRFIEALIVLTVFLAITLGAHQYNASSYAYAVIVGAFFFSLVSLFVLRQLLTGFSGQMFGTMFHGYGKFLIVGSLLSMIVATDKFLIGKLVGLPELGLYSAYYAASHLIVAELTALFMNVFWPSLIRNAHSMDAIMQKIQRLFVLLAPLWVALIAVNTSIFLLFFGEAYTFRWDYVILFSLNTFVGVLYTVYFGFLTVNHISRSLLYNAIFFLSSLTILIVFRSIPVYIVGQLLVQIVIIFTITHTLRYGPVKDA